MEDSKIIELYWARDELAIKQSEEKYGTYCFSVANNILSDGGEAEECVNDTWLKAWGAMPPNKPGNLKLFLAKITRNLAINQYNKRKSAKRGNDFCIILDELAELEFSNGESTEDEYIKKEFSEALNIFLGIISARERCIFVRRYFYAESSAKIAEKYGEKESNVNLILFRIRKKLKNYLEKEGFFT